MSAVQPTAIVEAPPNVEDAHTALAARLKDLFDRYTRDDPAHPRGVYVSELNVNYRANYAAFKAAVERDDVLRGKVRIVPPDGKNNGWCNGGLVCIVYSEDLGRMLKTLRHELVHAEQYRRSGRKMLFTDKLIRARKAGLPFSSWSRMYYDEPVEAQARGVEYAADLRRLPPETARRVMRAGGYNGYKADASAKGFKRWMKNVYQSYHQQAESVVHTMLEDGADPDDPARYVDDYAEGHGFTRGSKRFVSDALVTYQKLQRDGVLRVLGREFAKGHARPLDDEDIAEGILALMPEMRGMHGPLWVKKWLQKHATNYF